MDGRGLGIARAFEAGYAYGAKHGEATPKQAWLDPIILTYAENDAYCQGSVDGARGDTFRLRGGK
jgi:hypothetical protein